VAAPGGSLIPFFKAELPESQISVIDILGARIEHGKRRFPGVDFRQGDARSLPYADASFDVVFSGTLFLTIPDDALAAQIAREMARVVKPGGHIICTEWTFLDPRNRDYKATGWKHLRALFPSSLEHVFQERGALISPLGRKLSKYEPWAYFVVQAVLPLLETGRVFAMKKHR
jgi:ubiquinone/menaquinone biosynthesis C-methylase UbiE